MTSENKVMTSEIVEMTPINERLTSAHKVMATEIKVMTSKTVEMTSANEVMTLEHGKKNSLKVK